MWLLPKGLATKSGVSWILWKHNGLLTEFNTLQDSYCTHSFCKAKPKSLPYEIRVFYQMTGFLYGTPFTYPLCEWWQFLEHDTSKALIDSQKESEIYEGGKWNKTWLTISTDGPSSKDNKKKRKERK